VRVFGAFDCAPKGWQTDWVKSISAELRRNDLIE
jgi:hypothetical protein